MAASAAKVFFERRELDRLLGLYGRMVAAGEWRDYALDPLPDRCIFSVFRRASERPQFQIEKCPDLAGRQGAWRLVGAQGQTLRRGKELAPILAALAEKVIRTVD